MEWMRAPDPVVPAIKNTDKTILDSYCWRPTARSQLSASEVDGDRARLVLGHSARDADTKNYLEHWLPELSEAIEGLPGVPA